MARFTPFIKLLANFSLEIFLAGANRAFSHRQSGYALLNYAAETWGAHFCEAQIMNEATIILSARRICKPNSMAYPWRQFAAIEPLEEDADIETKDSLYGWTRLVWAAGEGHEAVVQLLLEKGTDVNAKDIDGQTPLWLAAAKGHEAIVRLLMKERADIHIKDKHGRTPLMLAARRDNTTIVQLLLEKGADIMAKDSRHNQTPLSWAADRGHEAVVRLLLERGADLEAES
ncbi:ankyrin repeat protein [Metarhizium robertsii]|uniref:Ankyrin repeat protein n=2 Tax=Metarhizium robertsii TaxID=568076 RepID=A0A0A1VA10_9HYPO|nr:ankyrin repeat protein [Metarhizium robertsii]